MINNIATQKSEQFCIIQLLSLAIRRREKKYLPVGAGLARERRGVEGWQLWKGGSDRRGGASELMWQVDRQNIDNVDILSLSFI